MRMMELDWQEHLNKMKEMMNIKTVWLMKKGKMDRKYRMKRML